MLGTFRGWVSHIEAAGLLPVGTHIAGFRAYAAKNDMPRSTVRLVGGEKEAFRMESLIFFWIFLLLLPT